MQEMAQEDSRVIAIDGKTVRGVASKSGFSSLHIVSAFCEKNRLTLCQEIVGEKTNEITAIPALLDLIEIKDSTITIDAMGCQKSIAEKIRDKKADYILQVKDNQKGLKNQIEKLFKNTIITNEFTKRDTGHGRMEKRVCRVIDNLTFLDGKEEWKDIKTIVEIKSETYQKLTQLKSESVRYYITSLEPKSEDILQDIRSHWSIENNLHWNLDVIFKEDFQLKRKGNSSANFNVIIKMSLGLIEAEKTTKKSKPLKRLMASLDDDYREKILNL